MSVMAVLDIHPYKSQTSVPGWNILLYQIAWQHNRYTKRTAILGFNDSIEAV